MNRAQRSQLREITVQLAELKGTLKKIRGEIGEATSAHEEVSIIRASADIENAIKNLQGAI